MDRIRFSRARIQNVRTFANNVDRAVRLNHEINAIATPRIERNILRDNINPLESYDDLKFRQNFAFYSLGNMILAHKAHAPVEIFNSIAFL